MSHNNIKLVAHCKVCQDAGKSEAIYRSHFIRETRDPNSRVTCPTLLALECRFCFKKGHTVKYCPTLKQKDMKQQVSKSSPKNQTKPVEKSKPKNQFACLESDSEDEDQKVKPNPIESFPQLCPPAKTQYQESNYAAALASTPLPKSKPLSQSNTAPKLAPWVSAAASSIAAPVAIPPPLITRNPRRCWADDSDTEDEDEAPSKQFKVVVPVLDEDW